MLFRSVVQVGSKATNWLHAQRNLARGRNRGRFRDRCKLAKFRAKSFDCGTQRLQLQETAGRAREPNPGAKVRGEFFLSPDAQLQGGGSKEAKLKVPVDGFVFEACRQRKSRFEFQIVVIVARQFDPNPGGGNFGADGRFVGDEGSGESDQFFAQAPHLMDCQAGRLFNKIWTKFSWTP